MPSSLATTMACFLLLSQPSPSWWTSGNRPRNQPEQPPKSGQPAGWCEHQVCQSEPAYNELRRCAGGGTAERAPLQGAGGLYLHRGRQCQASRCLAPAPRGSGWETPRCRDDWPPREMPHGGRAACHFFSLFSAHQWHPGLSQALSLLPTFPTELLPLTLFQPPWSSLSSFHISGSVLPLRLCTCCSLHWEHPAWPLHTLQVSVLLTSPERPSMTAPSKVNPHSLPF